ncbi:hypothetical protein PENTCL1PPCAC_21100, partial [Pristionchus entomophagus]
ELGLKDQSGHRSSPLFQKFNGTYFSCLLNKAKDDKTPHGQELPDGYIYPPNSFYEENRRSFDTDKILNKNSRLFFADMHCFEQFKSNNAHYVHLVVCQLNSPTYHLCVDMGMISLDWSKNCFLRWLPNKNGAHDLWNATQLLKLPEQPGNPHSVWPEIVLCDTNVRIQDGLSSVSNPLKRSVAVQSYFKCMTCRGDMSLNSAKMESDSEHRESRLVNAEACVESHSLSEIKTKFRSTDCIQTTLTITEKKGFKELKQRAPEECSNSNAPFSIPINIDSLRSEFIVEVEQKDRKSDMVTDHFRFIVRAGTIHLKMRHGSI